jgi:prephenate dehydrogenase
VLIAVPIAVTQDVIESVIPHLKKDALLTDITSLKVMPMKAMQKAPCAILGMHPLFGPSVVSAQGQKIVFCQATALEKKAGQKHINFLGKLFKDTGMEIIEMSAEEHDRQMALVQALTHSSNILFAKTLAEQKLTLDPRLQTPIFTLQSLTEIRVLQQEPELMADIQLLNPHFLPVLESLLRQTQTLLKLNQTKNRKALLKSLESVHTQTQELAPFALRHTNKILQMLQEKPTPVPTTVSKKEQKIHLRVAYLGPEGTNTHQAALTLGENNSLLPQMLLDDMFAAVLSDKADIGVVPAENSLQGTIRETLDLLSDSPLQVTGSFDLPIHHCLLSLEHDIANVQTVISHPQALAQCKAWLATYLYNVRQQQGASTTAALTTPKK